jgi:aarF domain-containing kinase
MSIKYRKLVFRASLAIGTASISAYYWPEIKFNSIAVKRSLSTAITAGTIAIDYKLNYPYSEGDIEGKNLVHSRSAKRLLSLFQSNGGIYIKIGQHLSALEYILPAVY